MDQLKYLRDCCEDDNDFSFNNLETYAKCVSVYDGDTCRLKFFYNGKCIQYACRMFGYDTYEMKPKKGDRTVESINEEKMLANRAKKVLSNLINNKIVYVKFYDFDKYGRPLITIYQNKDDIKSVNDEMVDSGNARVYYGGKKQEFS